MGIIAIPVGLKAFGLAERFAKRAGRLARSGWRSRRRGMGGRALGTPR
jgi:hypothetical protein